MRGSRNVGSSGNGQPSSTPQRFTATRRTLVKAVVSFVVFQVILTLWGYNVLTNTHEVQPGVLPLQQTQQAPEEPLRRNRQPDGHFLGHPVYFHDLTQDKSYHSRPYSTIRCAGENYQGEEASWMQRSCHFRFLCFNVSSKEFEVYARPVDEPLQTLLNVPKDDNHPLIADMTSSVIDETGNVNSVSLGGIRPEWIANKTAEEKRHHPLKWFPRVVDAAPPEQYYALDENVVLAPFHPMGGWNDARSVLWDDLFPIYNLLHMFQLHEEGKELLLMRMELKLDKFQPSCNGDGSKQQCLNNLDKFGPLLAQHEILTHQDSFLTPMSGKLQSNLVCAKDGVAGLGTLTSTGTKNLVQNRPRGRRRKKQREKDFVSNNVGRGGVFWQFRNYCLHSMGLGADAERSTRELPTRVTFAVSTQHDLNAYQDALQHRNDIPVEVIKIDGAADLTKHVEIAMKSTIFVTADTRAAALSAFLPLGATFIALFGSDNDALAAKLGESSTTIWRNEWDLFNHLSHVKVSWLPIATDDSEQDLATFVDLVVHEVEGQRNFNIS